TVNPGDTFLLIGEQTGWLEIKLPDGRTGWVSNQYAKKQ
ncbi:SH3 domain-containing protein, partial [Patescibacteria group bacterium]|nr:SH3 domain-containing protein [Patescibacteria group bacterium]